MARKIKIYTYYSSMILYLVIYRSRYIAHSFSRARFVYIWLHLIMSLVEAG